MVTYIIHQDTKIEGLSNKIEIFRNFKQQVLQGQKWTESGLDGIKYSLEGTCYVLQNFVMILVMFRWQDAIIISRTILKKLLYDKVEDFVAQDMWKDLTTKILHDTQFRIYLHFKCSQRFMVLWFFIKME